MATIIPFPSERAALQREFGALFPESTREDREAFANLVALGVDKQLIIAGRRWRESCAPQERPLPRHGELARKALQRAQARREARCPGGAG